MKIGDQLTMGTTVVPKGTYLLEHRVEGNQHVIVLTLLPAKQASNVWTREFQTQLVPEHKVANQSSVFGDELPSGSIRLSAIQIAGEAGDHILRVDAN